jgi:hypothetical protein
MIPPGKPDFHALRFEAIGSSSDVIQSGTLLG